MLFAFIYVLFVLILVLFVFVSVLFVFISSIVTVCKEEGRVNEVMPIVY